MEPEGSTTIPVTLNVTQDFLKECMAICQPNTSGNKDDRFPNNALSFPHITIVDNLKKERKKVLNIVFQITKAFEKFNVSLCQITVVIQLLHLLEHLYRTNISQSTS